MIKQINFVKIQQNTYNNKKCRLVTPKKRAPDNTDIKIVSEIVKFLKKRKILNIYGGEWEYLNKEKRKKFLKNLKNINIKELEKKFSNLFQCDASYGIVTPSFQDVRNKDLFKSQIRNDIDAAIEFGGLKNFSQISIQGSLGNPYGIISKNKVIMPDSPRHFYFAKKINDLMLNKKEFSILEIGGGYGGVIRMISQLKKSVTFYSMDLTEGCLIQYYFLKKYGLEPKLITNINEIEKNKINIIPYEDRLQILKKIKKIDIVFNSRSFSEMNANVLNKYFKIINRILKPKYIYHENSNYLLFPKSKRHIEILGKDFSFDRKMYYLKNINISPFCGGSGRYREFLYKKIK